MKTFLTRAGKDFDHLADMHRLIATFYTLTQNKLLRLVRRHLRCDEFIARVSGADVTPGRIRFKQQKMARNATHRQQVGGGAQRAAIDAYAEPKRHKLLHIVHGSVKRMDHTC